MNFWLWTFDVALVLALLLLAWQLLGVKDLFKATVLFIAFGLLMALAWVRLAAPDVALAEAAVGSGVTGALLLSALGRLHHGGKGTKRQQSDGEGQDHGQ